MRILLVVSLAEGGSSSSQPLNYDFIYLWSSGQPLIVLIECNRLTVWRLSFMFLAVWPSSSVRLFVVWKLLWPFGLIWSHLVSFGPILERSCVCPDAMGLCLFAASVFIHTFFSSYRKTDGGIYIWLRSLPSRPVSSILLSVLWNKLKNCPRAKKGLWGQW
jgi:hypothetical protein